MKIEIIDEHDEVAVVEFNILVLDINEKPSITFKDISHVPELSSQGFLVGSICLLYTSPSPRDATLSRMPSSA